MLFPMPWKPQSCLINLLILFISIQKLIAQAVVVQLLSSVQLFLSSWTAAHQASLSFTVSWSLLQLVSIELVMPFHHLLFVVPYSFCPQSFPASRTFTVSWLFASGGQSIGASASAWVLPMSVQDWFPLGVTGLISLLSKGLSRVFFSTTIQKYQFFSVQPSLWSNSHICTWLLKKTIALTMLPQVIYFLTNTTTFPLLRED